MRLNHAHRTNLKVRQVIFKGHGRQVSTFLEAVQQLTLYTKSA